MGAVNFDSSRISNDPKYAGSVKAQLVYTLTINDEDYIGFEEGKDVEYQNIRRYVDETLDSFDRSYFDYEISSGYYDGLQVKVFVQDNYPYNFENYNKNDFESELKYIDKSLMQEGFKATTSSFGGTKEISTEKFKEIVDSMREEVLEVVREMEEYYKPANSR